MKPAKNKTRRRSPGRGSLTIIAALLLGSAVIRAGDGAGQAFARAPSDVEVSELEPTSSHAECKSPEDLEPMLEAFRERDDRLKTQEIAIRDRMHALRIADRELEEKLAALTQAEEALRETIALADTAAESDLDRLTRVYENMKPKQAAALFEEMNPNFAAGFLGRMRPEAAAGIMAGLSPEAAHTFSVVLAGRNANVPSE